MFGSPKVLRKEQKKKIRDNDFLMFGFTIESMKENQT